MEDKKKNAETVDIDNPAFADVLNGLDERIKVVLDKIYEGKEFKSGDIALKITLGVDDREEEYPVLKQGQVVNKLYKYKGLNVKYNISTTLKKMEKGGGEYKDEKELVKKGDGEYVEVPVKNSQMGMFDGGDEK
jgi:hypothetical protein